MYIYQKTIQRTVNGEQVDCMSLNMIADPTCNQVDTGIEPDFTMWREPPYDNADGHTNSAIYLHIKGDEDVSGNPLYITGVNANDGDDVNGVQVWVGPLTIYNSETGVYDLIDSEALHVKFSTDLNIDIDVTEEGWTPRGHIVFAKKVNASDPTKYDGIVYVGATAIGGPLV